MISHSRLLSTSLTPQQQAVVAHDMGPALVFAVAGAGKTTAMVHRIARLVADGLFPAGQILATSFGRENVADIRKALAPWPACKPVVIRTLHALGRTIILQARKQGHYQHLRLDRNGGSPAGLPQKLLQQAKAQARQTDVAYKRELDGLENSDFLDYVSSCKGNLQYADLSAVALPPAAQNQASQAQPPSPTLSWYLDLYQLFEQVRQQQGVITYDDMLLTGWEVLVTCPDVLATVQARYQAVLVDEYQDINFAQMAILDLLTAPHRNYMAIGDDDQTIYEWRGAQPQFILTFSQKYEAQTFIIENNFRSPAAPLLLANNVIAHNQQRHAKRLHLTQGLEGNATVEAADDLQAMSQAIGQRIVAYQDQGFPANEIAILVRVHAQTPPLEQELIRRGIPYQISQPFYERWEIKTLIAYLRLAWLEKRLQAGEPVSATMRQSGQAAWHQIANRPKRYLNRRLQQQIGQNIGHKGAISHTLIRFASGVSEDWLYDKLVQLADDLQWLAARLSAAAALVLTELDDRLGYRDFLLDSSSVAEIGEGRVVSVTAFLDYARQHGSILDFMQHINELSQSRQEQTRAPKTAVIISTIHKAKGLEWPIVFIPQCNEKIMPFRADTTSIYEEERRLFYVALTRTKQHLHLHYVKNVPVSSFLSETRWQVLLPQVAQMIQLFTRPVLDWEARELLAFVKQAETLRLSPYFHHWWHPSGETRQMLAYRIQQLFHAIHDHPAATNLKAQFRKTSLIPWQQIAEYPDSLQLPVIPGLDALLGDGRNGCNPAPAKPVRPLKVRHAGKPEFTTRLQQVNDARQEKDVAHLITALDDETVSIRYIAQGALREIGGEQTIQALQQRHQENETLTDETIGLLRWIAASSTEPEAIRTLAQSLIP